MDVKLFKAKALDLKYTQKVEGFYCSFPKYNACTSMGDKPSDIVHCIMTYDEGDWGMSNTPKLVSIDISTLEEAGTYKIGSN